MKIQIDLPEPLNKALKIEKAQRGFSNLRDTIISILTKWKTTKIKHTS